MSELLIAEADLELSPTERIEAIKVRLQAATPAPWMCINGWVSLGLPDGREILTRVADCAFILEAPVDVAFLLEQLSQHQARQQAVLDYLAGPPRQPPRDVLAEVERLLLGKPKPEATPEVRPDADLVELDVQEGG